MRSYPSTRAKPTPPVFRVCLQCPKTFRTTNKEIQKGGGKFCSTACYRASRMGPRSPLAERFWSKVDKDGPVQPHCPDLGACWPWAAATQKVSGYGLVNVDGAIRLAHRVSWTLAKGPIPDGLDVLHHCDYRPCVRPEHLFLGTDLDNQRDAVEKGRHVLPPQPTPEQRPRGDAHWTATRPESVLRGARKPNARPTVEEAVELRRRYAAGGVKLSTLAREFCISPAQASLISRGLTWHFSSDAI
jgi:hypothetical protein